MNLTTYIADHSEEAPGEQRLKDSRSSRKQCHSITTQPLFETTPLTIHSISILAFIFTFLAIANSVLRNPFGPLRRFGYLDI